MQIEVKRVYCQSSLLEELNVPMPFRDYPDSFPSHSRPSAQIYRMRNDCFAGHSGTAALEGISVLANLPAEGISVFAGPHSALTGAIEAECRPVYAFSRKTPPAIPTGRVFVQGAKGVNLAETVKQLRYEVESVPPYAPHAAWVVASDHSIASALSNLKALMAAAGLESVEPQMLRPAALRGGR
jgi:hypothetical protein